MVTSWYFFGHVMVMPCLRIPSVSCCSAFICDPNILLYNKTFLHWPCRACIRYIHKMHIHTQHYTLTHLCTYRYMHMLLRLVCRFWIIHSSCFWWIVHHSIWSSSGHSQGSAAELQTRLMGKSRGRRDDITKQNTSLFILPSWFTPWNRWQIKR